MEESFDSFDLFDSETISVASFLFPFATTILTKIGSVGFQERCSSWGFHLTDIRKIEKTLSTMKLILLDAEKKQSPISLGKLKDIIYDAEDVLDELECEALRSQVVKSEGYKNRVSNFFTRIKISLKIKEIRQRLDEIADSIYLFNLNKHLEGRHVYLRESFVDTAEVFGRDTEKKYVMNLLMEINKDENVTVIYINGRGAVGKTTVAKMVYGDKMIDEHFELKIWISVPKDCDVNRLMKEIYNAANGQNYAELTVDQLQAQLRQTLDDRKFLLVLDEAWCQDPGKWKELEELLKAGAKGSKIMVTTRCAEYEFLGSGIIYPIYALSNRASMSLFVKSAFRDGAEKCHPELRKLGNEIVKNCNGCPLALRMIGSLLYQNIDRSDWWLIENNANRFGGWAIDDHLRTGPLQLSYDHLPSQLQRCLAYCCLFPKHSHFNSNFIVYYWMALGFLASHDENQELEDIGMRYLKELFSRCFFQDVEDHGYYFTFQMHYLIHDLAMKVAVNECKIVVPPTKLHDSTTAQPRHVSFTNIKNCDQEVENFSEKLRTIIIQSLQSTHITESFINKCIANFKYLRLLCLNGLGSKVLSDSLSALKYLRFLDLSWSYFIEELSEAICELQSLQTLRLLGCSALKKLPKNMRKMISLRCLEITTQETRLPQIGIEYLNSLRYLHLHDCHHLVSLPEDLQRLTNVRTLVLQGCYSLTLLPRSIRYLKRLENLVIYSCPQLNLKMDLQEEEEIFLNLRVFMIRELLELVDLPRLMLQGSTNTLEYMRIEGCPKLTALPAWIANLTSLQKLEIVSCSGLSYLPDGMQNLIALKELKIQNSLYPE